MIKSKRLISLLIVLTILSIGVILGIFNKQEKNITESHEDYRKDKDLTYEKINKDNTVTKDFKTHLPLVIIDTKGKEIKKNIVWDNEKKIFVEKEKDLYTDGEIKLINNKGKDNKISDVESLKSNIKIKGRGNTSSKFEKRQYTIKLFKENGEENKVDILDMGEDHEWILNISMLDTSLIRNYLALNIGNKVMENSVESRYCEVIIKEGNTYKYEGVYLLMETVKRGKDRVNISKYNDKFTESSYLLRRDRYDENAILLDNYGKETGQALGYLEVKYPYKKDLTKRTLTYIEEDIKKFEKCLFSTDEKEFAKYRDYIDVDSFIDYFIINELFTNYDSGYHSTYVYKEVGGKIKMGPIWDFDMALSNNSKQKLKTDSTAMHAAPWFNYLLKDSYFVERLIKRYESLRKNVLSEDNLNETIDKTVNYLGDSIKRDRDRWEKGYKELYKKYKSELLSHDDEIIKIKEILKVHGNWLDENIDSLYQFTEFDSEDVASLEILGKNDKNRLYSILAITFIGIFLVSIIIVQRD